MGSACAQPILLPTRVCVVVVAYGAAAAADDVPLFENLAVTEDGGSTTVEKQGS
jgi:hypothetical protein